MSKTLVFWFALGSVFFCTLISGACTPPKPSATSEPTLEAAPLGKEIGNWKVVVSEALTLTVMAPGAAQVKLIYQPVTAVKRHVEIGTLAAPDDSGKVATTWQPGPDFTGDVWAEVVWPDGTKKKTNVLALASEAAITLGGDITLDSIGPSAETDESERSDKLTGGTIAKTSLAAGDHQLWITINIPAFRLTLWQNGREVKTYQIGIGRRDFPLPVGERKATEIVWNPDWIPPDSKWVTDVEPGEKIEADDPRNPLGKIKIRLGNAILIHEAAKPSDIGQLASHGCVRMLTADLYDLTEKIVAARKLAITKEQMEQTKMNTERLAIKLDPPLWVDINYDTEVVEARVLHLYPDVYQRNKDAVAKLRAELNGIASLDDSILQQMLGRVSRKQEFAVGLADFKAGRALTAGKQIPLTDAVEPKPEA